MGHDRWCRWHGPAACHLKSSARGESDSVNHLTGIIIAEVVGNTELYVLGKRDAQFVGLARSVYM